MGGYGKQRRPWTASASGVRMRSEVELEVDRLRQGWKPHSFANGSNFRDPYSDIPMLAEGRKAKGIRIQSTIHASWARPSILDSKDMRAKRGHFVEDRPPWPSPSKEEHRKMIYEYREWMETGERNHAALDVERERMRVVCLDSSIAELFRAPPRGRLRGKQHCKSMVDIGASVLMEVRGEVTGKCGVCKLYPGAQVRCHRHDNNSHWWKDLVAEDRSVREILSGVIVVSNAQEEEAQRIKEQDRRIQAEKEDAVEVYMAATDAVLGGKLRVSNRVSQYGLADLFGGLDAEGAYKGPRDPIDEEAPLWHCLKLIATPKGSRGEKGEPCGLTSQQPELQRDSFPEEFNLAKDKSAQLVGALPKDGSLHDTSKDANHDGVNECHQECHQGSRDIPDSIIRTGLLKLAQARHFAVSHCKRCSFWLGGMKRCKEHRGNEWVSENTHLFNKRILLKPGDEQQAQPPR